MTVNLNLEALRGSTVFGNDGEKIGKIGEVYLDDQTNEPTFATVNTGLFGLKETFVPLDRAQETADGLTVPFSKDFIKDAPNVDADGNLSPEEEQRIYDYYATNGAAGRRDDVRDDRLAETGAAGVAGTGYNAGRPGLDADRTDAIDADRRNAADADLAADRRDAVAGDRVEGDRDVVAHEERLATSDRVETRETGRVRLRKHVITDTETVEVPVRREEVHIQREKIDPNSAEARVSGEGVFEEDEIVVTTHEERPVVETEVVATERINLDKEVRQDSEQVSGEVRREEIVVDEDGNRR
ncbi:PRC and DUF2382 domain-containing protein [Falsarthrobacter nasiphocae]|uniref:Uncharacterized protein (TIGR02271 family) n=1 Tax=Falsarthrobacter nasiphocae TaxID=189863 RepID=A0AAE3YH06_9MICC|nr:PRC and DUF2382 domain-containing protein [Falsarthrobacter nasiphocae]MDR6892122.1 uncharacterized protein (TIGR02271 family) [Falsarthrobacter nasiphocae]